MFAQLCERDRDRSIAMHAYVDFISVDLAVRVHVAVYTYMFDIDQFDGHAYI
jgi:hypothetical protein